MSFPTVPGVQPYTTAWHPEKYADQCIFELYTKCIATELCNTTYESTFQQGGVSKLLVPALPDPTVEDYWDGKNLTYRQPTYPEVEIPLDQATAVHLPILRLQEFLMNPKLRNLFRTHMVRKGKIRIDAKILEYLVGQGDATNCGAAAGAKSQSFNMGTLAAPISLTAENVVSTLNKAGAVLDENDVPDEDGRRVAAVPPAIRQVLMDSELRIASTTGDAKSILRTGVIGTVDRFKIAITNNLPIVVNDDGDTVYQIPFGHPDGFPFAMALQEADVVPMGNTFGKVFRNLFVWGRKVTVPRCWGVLCAKIGS